MTDAPDGRTLVLAAPAPLAPPRSLSVSSMVIGIASILFGWVLIAPIAGVVVGVMGLRREPDGKVFAVTGLVLNGLALMTWLLIVIVFAGLLVSVIGFAATAGLHTSY